VTNSLCNRRDFLSSARASYAIYETSSRQTFHHRLALTGWPGASCQHACCCTTAHWYGAFLPSADPTSAAKAHQQICSCMPGRRLKTATRSTLSPAHSTTEHRLATWIFPNSWAATQLFSMPHCCGAIYPGIPAKLSGHVKLYATPDCRLRHRPQTTNSMILS
jgi:hypothetical protein